MTSQETDKDHNQRPAPRRRRLVPRKASPARRIRYAFETLFAFFFYGLFRIMPVAVASAVGGFVMSAMGPHMGASRMARRNLLRAFPDKSDAEREDILRGMWDNLGRVIAEYPHLRSIASRIETENPEILDALKPAQDGEKKPVIFYGAHLANWEACGILASSLGFKISLVYRKPNNPGVERLLRYARGGEAVGHIAKGAQGAREMMSALRAGEALGLLMDQKLTEGMAIPFFGQPAMTATALAQFALKLKCSVVAVQVQRLPRARFKVKLHMPAPLKDTGDHEENIRQFLTQVNSTIESWIRQRPAEWLWLHKRWPD